MGQGGYPTSRQLTVTLTGNGSTFATQDVSSEFGWGGWIRGYQLRQDVGGLATVADLKLGRAATAIDATTPDEDLPLNRAGRPLTPPSATDAAVNEALVVQNYELADGKTAWWLGLDVTATGAWTVHVTIFFDRDDR